MAVTFAKPIACNKVNGACAIELKINPMSKIRNTSTGKPKYFSPTQISINLSAKIKIGITTIVIEIKKIKIDFLYSKISLFFVELNRGNNALDIDEGSIDILLTTSVDMV